MQTSILGSLLWAIFPIILQTTTAQLSEEKPVLAFPCFDPSCSARFPEGGYCTPKPTSPYCGQDWCKSSQGGVNCHCCRNCHDQGCSRLGNGWYCANSTAVAASNKECIYNEKLCRTSSHAKEKCWCCPPDPPCIDTGCRGEGGECVKESQADKCDAIHLNQDLCKKGNELMREKCLCCLKSPKPCNETSRECAKRGPGYTCVPREEAADWPVSCDHSCHHDGDKTCRCCPPKPVEINCVDKNCSREFPGYECQNASAAKDWPKRCMESEKLCDHMIEKYDINMSVDNQFELYVDGSLVGSGADWQQTFTFSADAQVIGVRARDWGAYEGILLSASNGLVTDKTWKCLRGNNLNPKIWSAPGFDDSSWPYAVSYGYNVPGTSLVWGYRPGISASAQWIWAPDQPPAVSCRKALDIPRCFCCPPRDPVNNCTDTGCDGAFGKNYIGECKDVTNPNFSALSESFDLTATPTGENLCNNTVKNSCCRCFKKKPCLDDGCKDAFNGNGICVDVENDDLSTIDLTVDKKLGLCKNNLKKDCCYCYKKKSMNDCSGKCTYKDRTGVCVPAHDVPPPNHMKTDGECPGKHCGCWVPIPDKCSRDPVCEESLHGVCVPEGSDLPDHRPSTYKCRDDDEKNCTCWTPHCFNQACSAKGGRCFLPWEVVPAGYMPTGFACNEKLDCQCYTREPCNPTKDCEKVGGTCRYPDDPRPTGEVEMGYCDEELGCKCYYAPCNNPECTKTRGLCVKPGAPVPSSKAYSYKPGDFCNRELDCKCYRPKCVETKTCSRLGGQCFMSGMKIPVGAEQIVYKGKPLLCNRKLKCKCMRVPKENN